MIHLHYDQYLHKLSIGIIINTSINYTIYPESSIAIVISTSINLHYDQYLHKVSISMMINPSINLHYDQ